MIYHFVLNPKSGKKRSGLQYEEAIKNACQSRHLSYHIYYTTSRGDATAYVRSMLRISTEKQRFICVGGDGTINEIVSGTVPFSRERIASEFKSRGVLELNAGAAERLNIKIGDKLLLLESDKKVR